MILLPCKVNNVTLHFQPDCGSDITIITKKHLEKIERSHKKPIHLQPVTSNILAANHTPMKFIGRFQAVLSSESASQTFTVYVLDEDNDPPLLGQAALLSLGYIKYSPKGEFVKKTSVQFPSVCSNRSDTFKQQIDKLHSKYAATFTGIGCLKDYEVELKLNAEAKPFIHRAAPVPLHLIPLAKKRLKEFCDQGILEKLPEGKPIHYCTSMLVVPKPGNKHEVRIVGAFGQLNKYLERSRYIPAPRIEDFLRISQGATMFIKLDLKSGYHQLKLSEASKRLCTLSTFDGNYTYVRLPMGLKNSQDFFDERITVVLAECKNTITQRDDILIAARNEDELLVEYEKVLDALHRNGLTVSSSKSLVGMESVKFHGHCFDKKGLRPDPEKIASLKAAERPTNVKGLLSFICSCSWQERYIHRFSELVQPLRELVKKGNPMEWTEIHQKAFEDLKEALCEKALNSYFDPNLPTIVFTDAGKTAHQVGKPGGLAGILAQIDPNQKGGYIPIQFTSRVLSDTETRWSQPELEGRSVRYTLDKFRYYLSGAPRFTVVTDCKSLVTLFNDTPKTCPPRILRQILAVQDLDFEVVFRPGKVNPADFTSRCPITDDDKPDLHVSDDLEELVVKTIQDHSDPICVSKFKEEVAKDAEMQFLAGRITNGDWHMHMKDPRIQPYFPLREQLSIIDDLIVRGQNILVVPGRFRSQLIKSIHRIGHQGETKTRALVLQQFWFPNLGNLVEAEVRSCDACQHVTTSHSKAPLGMHPLPEVPFEEVNIDFKGPLHDGYYVLAFLDTFSRFPDVAFVSGTSFNAIINHLELYFSKYGTPRRIRTDNGPPFNGADFKHLANKEGFKHIPTTPAHPQANGIVENFMKNIKKMVDIARFSNRNYRKEVISMLKAKRATPHPALGGRSPYEVAFGTKMNLGVMDQSKEQLPFSRNQDRAWPLVKDDLQAYKTWSKEKHDENRNVRSHPYQLGDMVLVSLRDDKKRYQKEAFQISGIKGNIIKAMGPDGRIVTRHSNHFKPYRRPRPQENRPQQNRADPVGEMDPPPQEAVGHPRPEHPEENRPAIQNRPEPEAVGHLRPEPEAVGHPRPEHPEENRPAIQNRPIQQPDGEPRRVHFNPEVQQRRYHTRSQGQVPEYPRVMRTPIERSRNALLHFQGQEEDDGIE